MMHDFNFDASITPGHLSEAEREEFELAMETLKSAFRRFVDEMEALRREATEESEKQAIREEYEKVLNEISRLKKLVETMIASREN